MPTQVAVLNEALAAQLTGEVLDVVVNVQVVHQVANFAELGLAVVVLAQHFLVRAVARWVHFLDFVVLAEGLQLQDFEVLVLKRVHVEEVAVP